MDVTLKGLRKLPVKKWDEVKEYEGLYVIPSGEKHDSGWALMHIIGINGDDLEIAASCDDICWDVTQGRDYGLRNDMKFPSGILHYWASGFKFEVGNSLSSTNVTLIKKQRYDTKQSNTSTLKKR